jgi:FtsZ-binding cell division protein ZapB
METDDLIKIVAILVGGGGFGGAFGAAYAMMKKAKPEAQNIIIESAKGAVIVHTGVIKDLEQELDRVQKENNELRQENQKIRQDYDKVLTENREIKQQLRDLQDQIIDLTRRTTVIEQHNI